MTYSKVILHEGSRSALFWHIISHILPALTGQEFLFWEVQMDKQKKVNNRDWAIFINPRTGRHAFNQRCKKCVKNCKQSYRVNVVTCCNYRKK